MSEPIFHTCGKCKREYTLGRWRGLPCKGVQFVPHKNDDGTEVEVPHSVLRDCICKNTMGVLVEREGDTIIRASRGPAPDTDVDGKTQMPWKDADIICWRIDAVVYASMFTLFGYEQVTIQPLRHAASQTEVE